MELCAEIPWPRYRKVPGIFFNLFEHLQSNPSEAIHMCKSVTLSSVQFFGAMQRIIFGSFYKFDIMTSIVAKSPPFWLDSATDFFCSFYKNSSFGNCLSRCCRLFIWTALNAMIIRSHEYQWHDWTSNDKIDSTVRQHTEAEYTMRTPSNWDLPESFRPFSILSISGKIFEQTIKLIIDEHSDRNNRWKFSNSSSPHI